MKKAMKIMAMVLFVAGMTALTSCSKSNDKLIVGKWQLEAVSAIYGEESIQLTMDQIAAIAGIGEAEKVFLEFKTDGKVYFDGGSATYKVEGDKLKINEESEAYTITITELTSKALTLEVSDVEDGGTFSIHFKKV